jgi:chromosome segregation ATPase
MLQESLSQKAGEIKKLQDVIEKHTLTIGTLKGEIAKEKERQEDIMQERNLYQKELKKKEEELVGKD